MSPLMSTQDIAEHFGKKYHSARRMTLEDWFPKPVNADSKKHRVWLRKDIEAIAPTPASQQSHQ